MLSWLRIHSAVFYRLYSPQFWPLKRAQWRDMLAYSFVATDSGPRTGKSNQMALKNLQEHLQDCLAGLSLEGDVSAEHLATAQVQWRNCPLTKDPPPPAQISQEVLWELFEVGFRYELLTVDHHHTGNLNPDRKAHVLGLFKSWNGTILPGNPAGWVQGFAGEDFESRRENLQALYKVMLDWPDARMSLTEAIRPCLAQPVTFSDEQKKEVEGIIVRTYILCSRDVLQRAPILPRALPF
jgi:hypothetical protein